MILPTHRIKTTVRKIFDIFKKLNPQPTTELKFSTPFELLIAVMLSAQATDVRVNLITPQLFRIANTPEKILALGKLQLIQLIKSIGLYNSKAQNILKTCQILVTKFGSQVPEKRADLESLPGVGRKTANIILNMIYNEPTIAVDTHIFRVARRIGLANGKTPHTVEKQLIAIIPKIFLLHAHHWLVLHGRYICVARKPKCPICPISKYCEYQNKTRP